MTIAPRYGVACAEFECPNGCSGHGDCDTGSGFCECHPGFSGRECSVLTCLNNCNNRGVCDPLVAGCVCGSDYSGVDCGFPVRPSYGVHQQHYSDPFIVQACPLNCSGNGDCVNGVCMCASPFSGMACETNSCPNWCSGHGICKEDKDSPCGVSKCECLKEWTGDDCSIPACGPKCNSGNLCDLGQSSPSQSHYIFSLYR